MIQKTVFKIYTEDLKREEIFKIVTEKFQGFTVYNATGFWMGLPEKTIVIEIIEKHERKPDIIEIADNIKKLNKQQAILITYDYNIGLEII